MQAFRVAQPPMAKEIQDFAEMPAVNQVEWHPYHHDDEVMLGALCRAQGCGTAPSKHIDLGC